MPSLIGNSIIKALLNSPFHPLLGRSLAVITVKGRKSGREYSTPINVQQQGEKWTVISLKERTWWRNLRDGRIAQLRFAGSRISVQGRIIETPVEVAAGLIEYLRRYPIYARYFGFHLGPDGRPNPGEVAREAAKRVIIHLNPV